jgi:hypothetical protein
MAPTTRWINAPHRASATNSFVQVLILGAHTKSCLSMAKIGLGLEFPGVLTFCELLVNKNHVIWASSSCADQFTFLWHFDFTPFLLIWPNPIWILSSSAWWFFQLALQFHLVWQPSCQFCYGSINFRHFVSAPSKSTTLLNSLSLEVFKILTNLRFSWICLLQQFGFAFF